MYYNKFTKRNYEFTKGGPSMAQQKPGVMLYFEMRNVFEELSNEKRNPGQRDSRLLRFPFPLTNGLHLFLTAPNRKHQMIPIGIQLQQQQQPQQQRQQQPQQQPQQIVVICPRRASRPGNHSDRFPPRYFPNPPGSTPPNRSVPLPCGRMLSAPTGARAKPQSKLSPPPGSNFVVFSAAQCLYW